MNKKRKKKKMKKIWFKVGGIRGGGDDENEMLPYVLAPFQLPADHQPWLTVTLIILYLLDKVYFTILYFIYCFTFCQFAKQALLRRSPVFFSPPLFHSL